MQPETRRILLVVLHSSNAESFLAVVVNKKAEKPETQHTPVAQIEVCAGKKLLKSFLLSENY